MAYITKVKYVFFYKLLFPLIGLRNFPGLEHTDQPQFLETGTLHDNVFARFRVPTDDLEGATDTLPSTLSYNSQSSTSGFLFLASMSEEDTQES